jgi:16S rRNA (guanine527-N7)-methyltransferase
MSYDLRKFEDGLSKLNIKLEESQMLQFLDYYEFIIEKNRVMNLTTITDFEEVVEKHFLDSLSIVKAYDMNKVSNLLDLGSGAGFPGIPIKIVFPKIKVTLLDSLNKRVIFLNEVISKLGLSNIFALHGRAEELARKNEFREKFDLCVSRAVANLSYLSEYCIPFVKVNGSFISYKSLNIEQEIELSKKAIALLGGKISDKITFQLPGTDVNRSLIIIEKLMHTNKIYPRKAGLPKKSPIL